MLRVYHSLTMRRSVIGVSRTSAISGAIKQLKEEEEEERERGTL